MAVTSRLLDRGIIVLAIIVRIAAVLILQSHQVPRSTYEHGEIAANMLAGRGFSVQFLGAEGPTSQQAPIYPIVVAIAYGLAGVDQPTSLLLLELCQSVLGGLLVLGVMRVARFVAPGCMLAAWAAGLTAALHPTLIYAATHVQVAALGATLLVWTLVWGYRTGVTGRVPDALKTGAMLALLALTDPILSLVGIGVFWAIAQGRIKLPERIGRAVRLTGLVVLTAALGIMPWTVRNALIHGEFVPIKSTFGYAFWQGNCALSEGTDKVVRASVERVLKEQMNDGGLDSLNRALWAARHEAGYLDDIALTNEDYRLLGSVSEPERSRILFRRAVAELQREPGRYLRLCLRRFRYFWLFDETNPKTRVLAYRASHLGLLALAVIGLVLARPAVRRRLGPTIATAVCIALFHTLTIVSARFHIPIEPLMALWAASGLTRWEGRLTSGGSASAAPADHVKRVWVGNRFHRQRLVGRLSRLART